MSYVFRSSKLGFAARSANLHFSDFESLSPPPQDPPESSASSSSSGVNPPPGIAGTPARRLSTRGLSRLRREAREGQVADAAAAADIVDSERRQVPCLACLNSALAGQSTGECWAEPGARRYERCDPGGSCRPIPPAALPVALFFLDYVQNLGAAPTRAQKTEKNKRRIAVKVVVKGCQDGTFPSTGDPRLA
ncbi:hypothetical protein FACUT_12558 [Fusarium acutatum]|uniref:Uncharacterized protein n=1 Tax=Fusarium acutatum TaxID=78861 RepID=A0A8H4NEQ6_9HYPO|nr:hypothetical protein FACUT_12558 [Fusarium acutatum]